MNHESQTKEHPTAVNHDPASSTHSSQERGLAIILVIFMVALASAILFSLTDSTYVAMRLNSAPSSASKQSTF